MSETKVIIRFLHSMPKQNIPKRERERERKGDDINITKGASVNHWISDRLRPLHNTPTIQGNNPQWNDT